MCVRRNECGTTSKKNGKSWKTLWTHHGPSSRSTTREDLVLLNSESRTRKLKRPRTCLPKLNGGHLRSGFLRSKNNNSSTGSICGSQQNRFCNQCLLKHEALHFVAWNESFSPCTKKLWQLSISNSPQSFNTYG